MRNQPKLVLAGALLGALAGHGCGCEEERLRAESLVQLPAPSTAEELRDTPQRHVGRTVTVSGEIDEVLGEHGFELQGDGIIWDGSDGDVLVLTRAPVRFGPRGLHDDDDVIVRGTVKPLSIPDLERELGRDLPDELARYGERPVLVADSVRVVETGFEWSEDAREGTLVSLVRLISDVNPEIFAGTAVDLDDVPVLSKVGRGLWIGYGPRSQIFVVPTETPALADIPVGARVDLKGTIRKMPPEFAITEQFELGPIQALPLTGEPVFIEATAVTVSAPPPAS